MNSYNGQIQIQGSFHQPALADRWNAHILIVGGGPASTAAATELRQLGFRGAVTVLSAEPDAPYDRPACSKGVLTGEKRPRHTWLDRPGPDVDWHIGRAVDLDPDRQVVQIDNGELIHYDGLVIATGGHSNFPHDWPAGQPGLHLLHTIADSWAVRRDLRDARRVAIIGGGLTGCETASSVHHLAREAVIIDPRPQLMTRAIGAPVGALMTDVHVAEGIDLVLGRRVKGVHRRDGAWHVTLDDGGMVSADVVVTTVGERPDTGWLADSGLDITDGVACDSRLRVIGADNIVAAGAVARWPNARYDEAPSRSGQWIGALEQGRAAARTLLYGEEAPPVGVLTRFWSQQHGLAIQACGKIEDDADVTITKLRPRRSDVARAGVLAAYRRKGRLVGMVGVNAASLFTTAIRPLLAQTGPALTAPPQQLQLEWVRRLAAVS